MAGLFVRLHIPLCYVCLWKFSSCMQQIWNENCTSPGSATCTELPRCAASTTAPDSCQDATAASRMLLLLPSKTKQLPCRNTSFSGQSTKIVSAVAPTSGQDQSKVTSTQPQAAGGIYIFSLHNLQGTLPFESIYSLYLIDGYQSFGLHLAWGFENVISFYYITGKY